MMDRYWNIVEVSIYQDIGILLKLQFRKQQFSYQPIYWRTQCIVKYNSSLATYEDHNNRYQ